MQLIPEIGSVGRFVFKDPFSKLFPPDTVFSCQSVRKYNELLERNEEIFEVHYKPNGLTQDQYDQDVLDDISLISLQASTGGWHHVPSTYLLSYPNTNGVIYTRIVLGVGLGAIPDNLDLKGITATIAGIVYDQLGITSEIKPIAVSQSTVLSHEDHAKIEEIRSSKVKLFKSDSLLLQETARERDAAFDKIQKLENFIKLNIHKLNT